MSRQKIITKSKYINGLKCTKLLWIDCNDRERIPPPDIGLQHVFAQGNEVGELAKKLYPEGIDVPYERGGFYQNLEETQALLSSRKPLFEAGFLTDDLYARVDILRPSSKKGKWDILEVKSSTGLKDVHKHDIAFQKYCCESSGLKIDRCFLLLVDTAYVKDGDIVPEEFFAEIEVTDDIQAYDRGIQEHLLEMRQAILEEKCPEIEIGTHCKEPYSCAMEGECWKDLPEDNIFTLYNCGPKKGFPLYESGIKTIRQIEENGLSVRQIIQKSCEKTGEIHLDKEAIEAFIHSLDYPVYFMDFETINPAVPLFDGTRPYQRIPFQFSVHIQKAPGEELTHHGFLSTDREDPRGRFLEALKGALGAKGSVMVFNRGFEEGVLSELAAFDPQSEGWVQSVKSRVVDLLKPFRSFAYYNPAQHGSASIKKVLPAVTGKGYEDMGIAGGGDASALYFHVTYGNAEPAEKEQVYSDLEKYCGLDTEGMVWIVEELRRLLRA